MSAYKNDLHIERSEEGLRLELAVDLLSHAKGVVVIDNLLALRTASQEITCEVILRGCAAPQLQIENAQVLLIGPTIVRHLQASGPKWIAVEDYGAGTVQVWPKRSPKPDNT